MGGHPVTETKSRYALLREQKPEYVQARWARGKTVLKWDDKGPAEPTHDMHIEQNYHGGIPWLHTPGQQCAPEGLCDLHELELADLLQTSPPVPVLDEDDEERSRQVIDQTIETNERTIRQEMARFGILVISPRTTDDGIDDPMTNIEDVNDDATVYETIDAETYGLIELEKKMYRAGELKSISVRNGRIQFRGYGKMDLPTQKALALDFYRRYQHVDEKRAAKVRALAKMLQEQGEKANILNLYGHKEAPKEYFETDEDPYRYELHETDETVHDVGIIVVPKDPDADPEVEALAPTEWTRLYYFRNHRVEQDPEASAWDRSRFMDALVAHFRLHVGTFIATGSRSDHDMAESEWDLGIDMYDPIDDPDLDWVKDLLATQS